MTAADPVQATCPAPLAETERVLLGHGSGGQLSAGLLRDLVVPALGPAAAPGPLQDAAVLPVSGVDLVVSTDSFVVSPLTFPGGDIGSLAVHGTVNDVAMRGAWPVGLALALVVEEGLELAELRRLVGSAGRAAAAAGVSVLTGDTKVVGQGAADRLYVTTTGIGVRLPGVHPGAERGRPGDAVLLSGPIGLHGTAIMSAREGLGFDTDPEAGIASDSRPLHRLVRAMADAGGAGLHTLRDPTRGGVASALVELAEASAVGVELAEAALPVPPGVAAACELLGLDPLQVANEGCLLAFVAAEAADDVLVAMRARPEGAAAVRVGTVVADHPGRVVVRTMLGGRRVLDMLVGEQLPRIC